MPDIFALEGCHQHVGRSYGIGEVIGRMIGGKCILGRNPILPGLGNLSQAGVDTPPGVDIVLESCSPDIEDSFRVDIDLELIVKLRGVFTVHVETGTVHVESRSDRVFSGSRGNPVIQMPAHLGIASEVQTEGIIRTADMKSVGCFDVITGVGISINT